MGKRTHRWTPPHSDRTPPPRPAPGQSVFGGTGPQCIWHDCDNIVDYQVRTSLCWQHNSYLRYVFNEYDREADLRMQRQITNMEGEYAVLVQQIEAGERIENPHNQRLLPGWVYYIELDGLIKIGFSKDVKKRMRQYGPTAKLLAAEPGTLNVERDRHQQFAAYLARGREWFRATTELRDWIRTVIDTYGTVEHMTHKWTGPERSPVVGGKRHRRGYAL